MPEKNKNESIIKNCEITYTVDELKQNKDTSEDLKIHKLAKEPGVQYITEDEVDFLLGYLTVLDELELVIDDE